MSRTFVQSIFDSLDGFEGKTLVVGGDGRFYNREVIQTVIRMAAANGFRQGDGGARRHPVDAGRLQCHPQYGAFGGIILSASHNPGGPARRFRHQIQCGNGGPAPEKMTDRIFARTKDRPLPDRRGCRSRPRHDRHAVGEMTVEVIDPVADYAALMEKLFDFEAIRAMFKGGFTHGVRRHAARSPAPMRMTFSRRLGAPAGTVRNGTPLPDFGGHHPDPNLVHAKESLRPDDVAKRAGFRRRIRRRRRPQPDHRQGDLRHPVGFAGAAGRQRAPRARLQGMA
jgi:phosphoglucomutase